MIALAYSRDIESRYAWSYGRKPNHRSSIAERWCCADPPFSQGLAFSVCIFLELAALGI